MASIVVTEFISLDGIIDSPGGESGYEHTGWTFKEVEFDPAAYELKGREQEEAGGLLLGRVSWDAFHPVWPTMAEFERYNVLPKYVVSTTLTEEDLAASAWQPATLLRSMADVAALKETADGDLQVHGSAALAQSLAAAGLVDRYHLLVFPLVLGHGKRLFPADGGDKRNLRLVEHDTYGNGIQKLCYEVVG